jgi:hypothetical protein
MLDRGGGLVGELGPLRRSVGVVGFHEAVGYRDRPGPPMVRRYVANDAVNDARATLKVATSGV